ncbi:hypothetical protein [Streptomyces longwoodensis]|uniref:hypothetical protein n=1 Tax=Streptomyces longwoodensis TaxID=68231 RepID=UPI00224E4EFE|nr:hypothetical protein [Streptomyces longwoodensis]MCX4996795.1 hypothetical protein [Streptomyces longwoodensis]
MYVRIITETRPSGWLLYAEETPERRQPSLPLALPVPRLGLAGVEDDPAEPHIVRGID